MAVMLQLIQTAQSCLNAKPSALLRMSQLIGLEALASLSANSQRRSSCAAGSDSFEEPGGVGQIATPSFALSVVPGS